MNYHLIDTVTLMRTIELLDNYNWLLATDDTNFKDDKATASLVLRALRNTAKRDAFVTKKPIC